MLDDLVNNVTDLVDYLIDHASHPFSARGASPHQFLGAQYVPLAHLHCAHGGAFVPDFSNQFANRTAVAHPPRRPAPPYAQSLQLCPNAANSFSVSSTVIFPSESMRRMVTLSSLISDPLFVLDSASAAPLASNSPRSNCSSIARSVAQIGLDLFFYAGFKPHLTDDGIEALAQFLIRCPSSRSIS